LFQLAWTRVAAKLHEEIADGRTRKTCAKMSGQEQHGRDAHQSKRHPTDFVSSGRFDRQHDGAGDESDQRKTEADDEQFERESNRPPGRPPARDESPDRPEGDECHGNSLDQHDGGSIATHGLEQEPHQIQAQDDRVPADDDEALEGAHEPSSRIRKEHVEEENGGQEQQTLSERPKRRGVGLRQP
jgi:hypothetical protein